MATTRSGDSVYKVTLRNHLRLSSPFWFYSTLLYVLPISFYYIYGEFVVKTAIVFGVAGFALAFVPHLVTHVRYSIVSAGTEIEIYKRGETTVVRGYVCGEKLTESVVARMSSEITLSIARNGFAMYPWQLYGFSVVVLADGTSITLTSLHIREWAWPEALTAEEITVKPYCWPPKSRISAPA